jgi:hypothetical protein
VKAIILSGRPGQAEPPLSFRFGIHENARGQAHPFAAPVFPTALVPLRHKTLDFEGGVDVDSGALLINRWKKSASR